MIKMHKDAKLGDSFYNTKDNKWYYFNSLNWVLPLYLTYKNYKNVISERIVLPINVYYGVTEHHKTVGWILRVWDIEKKAFRDFEMVSIIKIDK